MREKGEIRQHLQKTLKKGVTLAKIARGSGVPYSSLKAFRDLGTLGEEYRSLLDAFLLNEENKPDSADVLSPTSAPDSAAEMGVLLHNIGSFAMNTKWPMLERVKYIRANINAVLELLPILEQEAQKAAESQNLQPQKAPLEGRKK